MLEPACTTAFRRLSRYRCKHAVEVRRYEAKRGIDALLNARDIAALIRAREVLKRVEDAAWKRSLSHFDPYASVSGWDLGRLSDAASVADDAIFHVLSTARHNCHVRITDAQLHAHEHAHESARPTEAGSSEARTDSSTRNVGPNGDTRGEGLAKARGLPRHTTG